MTSDAMPASFGTPSEEDWRDLEALLAGCAVPFRHRMGIARADFRGFYGGTKGAADIRSAKAEVFARTDAARYAVETSEGAASLAEFVRLLDSQGIASGFSTDSGIPRAGTQKLSLALEPDWMLLLGPDWRLVWASVCFPTRWSLEGKAGVPVQEIHGGVPGLNAELGEKVGKFFARLVPGEGWKRANWGLSLGAELNQHPSRSPELISNRTPLDAIYLRVEAQHLQKLPESGAIVFGIRILHFALPAVCERSGLGAQLCAQLRTMTPEVAAYKGIPPCFWQRL
jgi:hypothetical protein